MKRERLTQIVLVIVGLLNLAQIYFLYMDLLHSRWLLQGKSEVHPMFLSFFIPVGVFLLMAARRPSEHRSMILRTEFNPRQYFTLRTTLGDFRCNLQTRECPVRGTSCAVVKSKDGIVLHDCKLSPTIHL